MGQGIKNMSSGSTPLLGKNTKIHPTAIVHDNVVIGDNTIIDAFCEIGYPTPLANSDKTIIGKDSIIRSHSVVYQGSQFGDRLHVAHRVTIRENTILGEHVQLGTLCDLQGDLVIGNHTRFHSNVHVGKDTRMGNYVWVFPNVVFTNDPHPPSHILNGATVGDYAVITTGCIILPGLILGKNCVIGAGSLVTKDVPEDMLAVGHPAKILGKACDIVKDKDGNPVYPWQNSFKRD
jgi:acetyltransferase-like isoleucine patch superfamily enzyme